MRFKTSFHDRAGIALIIVMLAITVLGLFAGLFAARMRVETQLARNTSYETELEWLGRSGVELARYLVAQQTRLGPEGRYSALRQRWAGGPGGTNDDYLAPIMLEGHPLAPGEFSIKVIDMERKLSINSLYPPSDYARRILNDALTLCGATELDRTAIADALQDWIDPDSNTGLQGAETDYYLSQPVPHFAKNGFVDEMTELLLLKGMTPEIFWGPKGPPSGGGTPAALANYVRPDPARLESVIGSAGLIDLFTAMNFSGLVNPNTASQEVLTLALDNDPTIAGEIIRQRQGYDGIDGTEDDIPFETPQVAAAVAGLGGTALAGRMTTLSMTFQVFVEARIGTARREFVAIFSRSENPNDPVIKFFHWR